MTEHYIDGESIKDRINRLHNSPLICECCKHEHSDYVIVCRNCYNGLMSDSMALGDAIRERDNENSLS